MSMNVANTRPPKILRSREARKRLGIGATKFAKDFRPRLREIKLGTRAIGFLEADVNQLIHELLAESTKKRSR